MKATNMTHTIDGQMGTLKYIADSPAEQHGGFAKQTVEAAQWALAEIERLTANGLSRFERDQLKAVEVEVEMLNSMLERARDVLGRVFVACGVSPVDATADWYEEMLLKLSDETVEPLLTEIENKLKERTHDRQTMGKES
jgi:rubrerythrin